MYLVTEFEPKISNYLVPASAKKVDFYGQMAVDLPPTVLTDPPRELYIIELHNDPSHTRLLSFSRPHRVKKEWKQEVDATLYRKLKDSGELDGWLRSLSEGVPSSIEILHHHSKAMMLDSLRADWWEVTW